MRILPDTQKITSSWDVINGIGMGCRSMFQIPKFGVSVALNKPVNVIEFTPTSDGDATFSCSMGMYRGSITVVKA